MAAPKVGVLRRLVAFLAPYKRRIAGALVALVVAAGSVLALGQGLKYVIDAGFSSGDPGLLDRALAGVIAVALVMSAATWARFYLMMTTGERVITDIRRAVYGHLLALEPAFFEQIRTGEVISRLTNDVTQLQAVIGFGVSMFLRNALMGLGALVMLVVTSGKLAALVVLGVPATLVPILLLGRKVRRLSRDNQDRVAEVSAYVDESIHEIRTVQAYGHEAADRRFFGDRAEAAYASGVARIGNKAFLISAVMLIAFCAVGLILWIGGHDVLAGRITAGELSAFVFYAMVVATAAGAISETWGELQRAAGSTERLMELLDTEPRLVVPANPRALPVPPRGEVKLDRVTFHYPARPEVPALAELTLAVAPGERVALVGPSGAGKSTVFQLLLRFYDPDAGRVLVDGVDARECDPRDLRGRLALVPQEPGPVRRERRRERALRPSRSYRCPGPRRLRGGVRARVHRAPAAGVRDVSRRARGDGFPAGSGSGCRSPGRCSRRGRCCSSTRRPAPSTPRASASSSSRSKG